MWLSNCAFDCFHQYLTKFLNTFFLKFRIVAIFKFQNFASAWQKQLAMNFKELNFVINLTFLIFVASSADAKLLNHDKDAIFFTDNKHLFTDRDQDQDQDLPPSDSLQLLSAVNEKANSSLENGKFFQGDLNLLPQQYKYFLAHAVDTRTGLYHGEYRWPKDDKGHVIVNYFLDSNSRFWEWKVEFETKFGLQGHFQLPATDILRQSSTSWFLLWATVRNLKTQPRRGHSAATLCCPSLDGQFFMSNYWLSKPCINTLLKKLTKAWTLHWFSSNFCLINKSSFENSFKITCTTAQTETNTS